MRLSNLSPYMMGMAPKHLFTDASLLFTFPFPPIYYYSLFNLVDFHVLAPISTILDKQVPSIHYQSSIRISMKLLQGIIQYQRNANATVTCCHRLGNYSSQRLRVVVKANEIRRHGMLQTSFSTQCKQKTSRNVPYLINSFSRKVFLLSSICAISIADSDWNDTKCQEEAEISDSDTHEEESDSDTHEEEEEEEYDDEAETCPFCRFFLDSPCKEQFLVWHKCVLSSEKATDCMDPFHPLKKCMDENEISMGAADSKSTEEDDGHASGPHSQENDS